MLERRDIFNFIWVFLIIFCVIGFTLLLSGDSMVNAVGLGIIMFVSGLVVFTVYAFTRHIMPKSSMARERIIKSFFKKHNISINSEIAQGISDASYYSDKWADEVHAMTYTNHNINEWLGEVLWLRLYLICFPQSSIEISPSMQDQYHIVHEKYKLLVSIINKEADRFQTDRDVIRFLNEHYLMNFDTNRYALWKHYMDGRNNVFIKTKTSLGIINTQTEIQKLSQKYETKA